MDLSQAFQDLLAAFAKHDVRYMLIGGYAVAFHGTPRATKDIHLWVGSTLENLESVGRALAEFGAPAKTVQDVLEGEVDEIVWFGVPPARVDVLKRIPGPSFDDAYPRRVVVSWSGTEIVVISAADLIAAKEAAGREQDLKDAKLLRRMHR